MAHHIADLIKTAEKERSPLKRRRAEREAVETILKIWEHREALPSYAYPLAQYEDLFKVVDRLQPDDNPFRYGQNPLPRSDELAAILFHQMSRLIICLLLMKPNSLYAKKSVNQVAVDALNADERHVWDSLQKWTQLFVPKSNSNQRTKRSASKTKVAPIDYKKIAFDIVEGIKGSFEELQAELKKPVAESRGSSIIGSKAPPKKPRKQRRNRD